MQEPNSDIADSSARSSEASTTREALDPAHLIRLLIASAPLIEEAGDISGYGFYRPENPHDFSPDSESCSEEEIANHRAACEAWDRGDYKREPGSEWFGSDDGQTTMHILRAPWGIGSYRDQRDDVKDLLANITCAVDAAKKAGVV